MITVSGAFLSDSFSEKVCRKERDSVLIGCHSEDELLEIPPAVLATVLEMAVGDGHVADVEVGIALALTLNAVVSTWRRCMSYSLAKRHSATISLKSSVGTVCGDRVECSAEYVVVEVVRCHAVTEGPIADNVQEELRIQVEAPFHEPETVEHHGLDDLSVSEVVVPCLGDGTVDGPRRYRGCRRRRR